MDTPTPKLYIAIAAARKEIPAIQNDQRGAYSGFVSLAAIRRVLNPILAKHGLSYRLVGQALRSSEEFGVYMEFTMRCAHVSGEREDVVAQWPVAKGQGQAPSPLHDAGGCASYAVRYSYRDFWELDLGKEPDADDNAPRHQPGGYKSEPRGERVEHGPRGPYEDTSGKHAREGYVAPPKQESKPEPTPLERRALAAWDKLPESDQNLPNGRSRYQAAKADGELQGFAEWAEKRVGGARDDLF